MDFLKINGAFGEGGGQIIRSALTISCITKQPVHIENIRKNRKIQGLKPQHLTAIKILKKISDSIVIGDKIGSTELKFIPGDIKSSKIFEDVGTAGSIPLILQVLIPIVAISQKKLEINIRGGTDVLWSPTMNFTQHILKEVYSRMGINFSLEIKKRGYYPKGGGEINLVVNPSKIKSIFLTKRNTNQANITCTFSNISHEKIENEINKIKEKLIENNFVVKSKIQEQESRDSGASILVSSIDENSIIGIDGLFNKNTQKFDLDLEEFLENQFSVDKNLADMIIVPASLAKGKTRFQVKKITKHLETNLFVTSKISGCKYGVGKVLDGFEIIIEGISYASIK